MRLAPGTAAPPFRADAALGPPVSLDGSAGAPLLLMFYRYASCPMCNLRLHDFARAFPALHRRGLEAIAFFHSPVDSIRAHAGRRCYPFPLAADPSFRIYRAYGVETSWPRLVLAGLLPSFYRDWIRAMRHRFWGGAALRMATMPADFLVGRDGRIAVAYYGRSIGDHLPIETLEAFVAREGRSEGADRTP